MADDTYDVLIVGGGVAGRSAGIYTARNGLETLILDAGGSILRRNARLENYPGFPAGVDARLLLDAMAEQAERAGCEFREAEVTAVGRTGGGAVDAEATNENRSARWSSSSAARRSSRPTRGAEPASRACTPPGDSRASPIRPSSPPDTGPRSR
jgi:flavin-dependent dehydrogenase